MRGRLRVVVGTTDGPSTVRRITAENPGLRSVVCLAGSTTALPISGDYDAFVRRPTGVVERDVGHGVFRVDVDRPIDEGRSWQLGFYLAHRLKLAGRLAEDDGPADGVVWATGTVDLDLGIGPVERVADKARRSAALFAGDLPVLAVAAVENAGDLPPHAGPSPDLLAMRSVREVLARLDLDPPDARGGGARTAMALGMAVLLTSATLGWGLWQKSGADHGDAPAAQITGLSDPGSVSFELLESRSVDGVCGPAAVAVPVAGSDAVTQAGVCEVAFRAVNTGGRPVHLWLYGAVQGGVQEYAPRRGRGEPVVRVLDPGDAVQVQVRPPDWMRRGVDMRGLLVFADGDRPRVGEAFGEIDGLSGGDFDALVARLRGDDVVVRELFHRVIPAR